MNPMANMVNVQVQSAKSPRTDQAANAAQSTGKSDQGTGSKGVQNAAKDQPKEFDDVLNEAVETPESVGDQSSAEQVPEAKNPLEGITAVNLVILNVIAQTEPVLPQASAGLSQAVEEVVQNGSQDAKLQELEVPVQRANGTDLKQVLEGLPNNQSLQQTQLPKLSEQVKLQEAPLQNAVKQNAETVAAPVNAAEAVTAMQKAVPVTDQAVQLQSQEKTVQTPEPARSVPRESAFALAAQTEAKPQQQKNFGWQGKQEQSEQPQLQNPNILSLRPSSEEALKAFSSESTVQAEPQAASSANPLAGLMQHIRMDTAATVQQPQVMQQPQPQPQVAQQDIQTQIIDQAKLIKTAEDTQMVIKLKPEHLGELTLKVSVDHGVVSASFHTENVQVRAMLESSLVQLKQDLQNQGIKVDNVNVYAGLSDSLPQGQEGRQANQQSSRSRNRKIDLEEFEDRVEQMAPSMENSAEDGVDYRI